MAADKARGVVLGSDWVRAYMIHQVGHDGKPIPGAPVESSYLHRRDLVAPQLRSALLYFDRIDVPRTEVEPLTHPEVDLLEQQGVIERTDVLVSESGKLRPMFAPNFASRGHGWAYREHEKREPGYWSMAPLMANEPDWGTLQLVDAEGIKIEILDRLPVPAETVAIAEILEFKHRHVDQLAEHRAYWDELYFSIIDSRDPAAARRSTMEKLDGSLTKLSEEVTRSGMTVQWWTRQVGVLLGAVKEGFFAQRVAQKVGVPDEYQHLIGFGAGTIRIGRAILSSPVTRSGPLTYLAAAHSEQIVNLRRTALGSGT